PSAKIIEARPVHQRRSSIRRPVARNRMYPKIAARRMAPIAAIARRTVVDRLGNIGPRGAGAGWASMDSALDRLAALGAELHVAGNLVAVRAPEGLGRPAFAAELQAGRDGLPAFDARLTPGRDRRVGAAVPAELHVRGVHRAALRAGPHLLLLRRLRDHAAHLGAHRVPHADARTEADAGPGPPRRSRRRTSRRTG